MSDTTKRVLPADVYDVLELSALAFGGIGAGWFGQFANGGGSNSEWENEPDGAPCCIHGHAIAVAGQHYNEIRNELDRCDIGVPVNDSAVEAINARRGKPGFARVSFKAWCAELGVERDA